MKRFVIFIVIIISILSIYADPVEFELEGTISLDETDDLLEIQYVDTNNNGVDEIILFYLNSDEQQIKLKIYENFELINETSYAQLDAEWIDPFSLSAAVVNFENVYYLVTCCGMYFSLYDFDNADLLDSYQFSTNEYAISTIRFRQTADQLSCYLGIVFDIPFERYSSLYHLEI